MRLVAVLAFLAISPSALAEDKAPAVHPCKKEIAKFCAEMQSDDDPRVPHCLRKARKDTFNAKDFSDECKKHLDGSPVRMMRKRWMKDMEESMKPLKK